MNVYVSLLRSTLPILALVSVGCAGPSDAATQDDLIKGTVAVSSQELSLRQPKIPGEIAAPEGNFLAFFLGAEGVQIYDCKVGATGVPAWVFRAPEADLFTFFDIPVGTHYAGPTWELVDGSKVVGSRVSGITVDSSAIPWLLLKAASTDGKGLMSHVTYIQRISTTGGNAPATGCDQTKLGAVVEVDYTATYNFYFARPAKK